MAAVDMVCAALTWPLQDKESAAAENAQLQAELARLQEEREAERPQVPALGACEGS